MEICYDRKSLQGFMARAAKVSPQHPVLVDQFLQAAVEIDVDAVCDGEKAVIAGIMEHIEEAGIHSGDSACVLPPYSIPQELIREIKDATVALALELNVKGLMNIQFAVKDGKIYVIEVNPRASRTIPFVSKATGIPWAKVATRLMVGQTLKELNITSELIPRHIAVKEAVFPFIRFPGVDTLLGPEMKSTGEVMGIHMEFGGAFARAQLGAGQLLPRKGNVLISVKDEDKAAMVDVAREFSHMGFGIVATRGTASFLDQHGINASGIHKVREGRPHIVDAIKNREVALVINTTEGGKTVYDSYSIRRAALEYNTPYTTTVAGALATVKAIKSLAGQELSVKALQDYHREVFSRLNL